MRDLQMIAQRCVNDLNSIGIYPNITADKFKATVQHNSWGMCHSSRNNRTGVITHRITISKQLVSLSGQWVAAPKFNLFGEVRNTVFFAKLTKNDKEI